MSNDFTKVLVQDDRLNVVDNIKYAVIKGGQSVNCSQFKALSETNSQLVFNIQVPSETTIIDRRVLLTTDLTLTVQSAFRQLTTTDGGQPLATVEYSVEQATPCGYGTYAGLAPYPLHQLMTVASATINNNTVSINIRDVLPFIVRALKKGDLNAYNGFSAVATDSYQSYTDSAYSQEGANSGGLQNLDTDLSGRGSIALINYSYTESTYAGIEVFTWRITEPLLLSPFLYCNPSSNAQGFYGIQNMNLVLNIGTASRAFRGLDGINGVDNLSTAAITQYQPVINADGTFGTVSSTKCYNSSAQNCFRTDVVTSEDSLPYIKNVALTSFANTYLYFVFLTPKPSQLMPSRNIVPYYELPRYITQVSLPAPTAQYIINQQQSAVYNSGLQADAGGTAIISQTLQLNQIPDKLVLYVRKPAANQSYGDADVFLPIRGVSINFNNNSGILSSARSQDLYRMSKDNGSNQNWLEWTGQVSGCARKVLGSVVPATDASQWSETVDFAVFPTAGSCLMLEFGKDIQLVEDYFAPGSLGNFNIQLNLLVDNTMKACSAPKAAQNFELVMITMNSGVFVCERGTSSVYTGILTRADVLEASEQEPYGRSDITRMVGGGFMDWLKSSLGKAAPILKTVAKDVLLPMAKEKLGQSSNPLAKGALGAMSALGLGRSGAGASAGARLSGRFM